MPPSASDVGQHHKTGGTTYGAFLIDAAFFFFPNICVSLKKIHKLPQSLKTQLKNPEDRCNRLSVIITN